MVNYEPVTLIAEIENHVLADGGTGVGLIGSLSIIIKKYYYGREP